MPVVRTVAVLLLCLAAGACGGGDQPTTEPDRAPTSIAQLDPGRMRVVRVAFCDLVPKAAVRAALTTAPTRARSWRNGDKVREARGEIGHEFGCAWYGPHARVARAWVFARPVTPAFARTLVRGSDQKGCVVAAKQDFGAPSVLQNCTGSGPRRIRYAGLFGQTWLTCELSGQGASTLLKQRADAWCAQVADALDAGQE